MANIVLKGDKAVGRLYLESSNKRQGLICKTEMLGGAYLRGGLIRRGVYFKV